MLRTGRRAALRHRQQQHAKTRAGTLCAVRRRRRRRFDVRKMEKIRRGRERETADGASEPG